MYFRLKIDIIPMTKFLFKLFRPKNPVTHSEYKRYYFWKEKGKVLATFGMLDVQLLHKLNLSESR